MKIYENVKAKIDEQGKTVAKVETEAGIANGTISGWKTGKPYAETLKKVAAVLHTTVDALIAE